MMRPLWLWRTCASGPSFGMQTCAHSPGISASGGGSWAAFAASHSRSRLEARLLFPRKTPLLLFGIIGLAGALLEIKEGFVAFFVEKLQNITKNHLVMLRTGWGTSATAHLTR